MNQCSHTELPSDFSYVKVKVTLKSWCRAPSGAHDQIFIILILRMISDSFITSRRPEYRSLPRTVSCHSSVVTGIPLLIFVATVFGDLLPNKGGPTVDC
jgi:hypothetical protein